MLRNGVAAAAAGGNSSDKAMGRDVPAALFSPLDFQKGRCGEDVSNGSADDGEGDPSTGEEKVPLEGVVAAGSSAALEAAIVSPVSVSETI